MADDLLMHQAIAYRDAISLLAAQRGSRFAAAVSSDSYMGAVQAAVVEQFGGTDGADEVTTKFEDISPSELEHDRRWVSPRAWDKAFWLDTFDLVKIRIQPTGIYAQQAADSLNLTKDDLIIAAASGTSKTGQEGTTDTAFAAGQIIAAGGTGLTVDKLKAARKLFMENEVDTRSDTLYIAVTADEHDQLLHQAEIIRDEYHLKPTLSDDGMISRYLGFNFIHSERLLLDGSGDRIIPIWVKSGLHLGSWGGLSTSIDQLKNKRLHPWQVYAKGFFGATRTEEKKVVLIKTVVA